MLDTRIVLACALAMTVTALALGVLSRLAKRFGLVDHPDQRKRHAGAVPLVGGLSIFTGVVAAAVWLGGFQRFVPALLGTCAALVLLGALDDRYNLRVRLRVLVQTAAILAMAVATDLHVHSMGHMLGHDLALGALGLPFTVVAVIGLLNAFNLMDGIDGLAGSLALVSIGAILLYSNPTPSHGPSSLLMVLAAALLPYLAANLGFLGRKVFLGDAGSLMLGYLLAWVLIDFSQGEPRHLSPPDVLWAVALPILDTLAVMYRRLRQGKSPFKPDRGHIHHIVMDAGLSPRRTLVCLIALACSLAFAGSILRLFGTAANMAAFLACIAGYTMVTSRLWARQQKRAMPLTASNDAGPAPFTVVPPAKSRQEQELSGD